jgi:hypothetical protein
MELIAVKKNSETMSTLPLRVISVFVSVALMMTIELIELIIMTFFCPTTNYKLFVGLVVVVVVVVLFEKRNVVTFLISIIIK